MTGFGGADLNGGVKNERQYIEEVLGVTSWIRPVATTSEPAQPLAWKGESVGTEVQVRHPLARVYNESWSRDQQALVEKILMAMQLTDVPLADEDTLASHVLVFDSESPLSRQMIGDQIFWNLGPLNKLLQGSPPEISQAKREVWNLLKQMKEEVGV